ncbi:MAG: DUF349 domain-containing protein [Fimbriimonadaceae bacterium]|nr:DUF349 domain-containing protein [Fimbriimonadaceae bacterium]
MKAIGTVADLSEPSGPLGGLGPLPVTHERKRFEVDLQKFQFGLKDEDIVQLMDGLSHGKRVAVLEAGTGTGKSTFAPFRLMYPPDQPPAANGSELYRPTRHGPIVVTEPRIPATTGVATFVGEALCFGHERCTRHIGPGFPVGYQKQGEKYWDEACQLIYVTDGTMINWIRDGRLARIGTVIVDEAHERSENIDLILALLRDQLPRYQHLRVIIASATIDKNFFIEYFGGQDKVHSQYVPAVKGVGYGVPMFPDIEITDGVIQNGLGLPEPIGRFDGWPMTTDAGEDVYAHTRALRRLAATEEIPIDQWRQRMPTAVAQQILRLLEETKPDSGDILAFLPTTDLIQKSCDQVRRGLQRVQSRVNVYALLSTVTEADKRAALAPSKSGERKVVISSNLAETSLTVSGVRYVVDSGLICQSEWDPEIAQESLPTKPHSQSGVRQRWGRVGRDQVGWVFPLYTQRQFLENMPRDTPPGSTRANLEQFLIKLKAAGVDSPASIEMPANFTNDQYAPDTEARRAADVFSAEIVRAELALAANGAVDSAGHLTALGRELQQFAGPAEQAIAIMFADRLACVPEVGVALALLSGGRLVGREALLRFDRAWPPAWRVQATACHRALAVGCRDDLDFVLRIAAAWARSGYSDAWARMWWINPDILDQAYSHARQLLETLSAAMKEEAMRAVDVRLIPRSRAVLSRALASLTYVPAEEEGTWRLELSADAQPVELGRQRLISVAGRLVALSRWRPSSSDDSEPPKAIIEGLVSVEPWAREGNPDPFELLLRASAMSHGDSAEPADVLGRVLDMFPVGTVVMAPADAEAGMPYQVVGKHPAPIPPYDLPDLDEIRDVSAESTVDDDTRIARRKGIRSSDEEAAQFAIGGRRRNAEAPDEELVFVQMDVRDLEENDSVTQSRLALPLAAASPATQESVAPTMSLPIAWEGPAQQGVQPGLVVGYEQSGDNVGLRLKPCGPGPYLLDLPRLSFGEQVTVSVQGIVEDHRTTFRVLRLPGDDYELFESEMTGSLDPRNRGWVLDLEEGTKIPAVAVPGFGSKDPLAVTLVPALHEYAMRFVGTSLQRGEWIPATLISFTEVERRVESQPDSGEQWIDSETPEMEQQATVQIHLPDSIASTPFQFTVEASKVRRMGAEEVGAQVEVLLASWRARLIIDKSRLGKGGIAERFANELEASDRGPEILTKGPLSLSARNALLAIDSRNPSWQRAVWKCWVDSHRLRIAEIRVVGAGDRKQELIDEAREIVDSIDESNDWRAAAERMQELFDEWKSLGTAGREDDDELWSDFQDVRQEFFDLRREYFEERDRRREEARAAKEELCEEAEELADSTDWKETAGSMKELMSRWREAGPAGRDDAELWERFQTARQQFFAARKEAFDANTEEKEGIVSEAEELLEWSSRGAARNRFKELRDELKAVGPGNWEEDRRLWDRFNEVGNELFAR